MARFARAHRPAPDLGEGGRGGRPAPRERRRAPTASPAAPPLCRPGALVRRVPAVHARHPDPPGPAARPPPIGSNAVIAVAWCTGIALAGFFWARALFNRAPAR